MKRLLAVALFAACMLTFCTYFGSVRPESGGPALALPVYPQMAPCPYGEKYTGPDSGEEFDSSYNAWLASRSAQRSQPAGYTAALEGCLRRSVPQLLSGAGDGNRICSPVNIYMALAMLAETTGGNSRAQLLDLLGSDSLEDLRAEAAAVWNANYCDDGAVTSVLANSFWLDDSVNYVQSTLDSLAKNYYASAYSGEMGSDELNEALQNWLNEQTGGLLEEQAKGVETRADTILALCSTIYFRDKWASEFSEGSTSPQTFHAPGGDVECGFMHSSNAGAYYRSSKFAAHPVYLESSGAMWLLLPAEGVTPEQLIADENTLDFLLSGGNRGAEKEFLTVNLAVPRFDVFSDLELSESLKALGVSDVFDYTVSDFSPLTGDTDQVYLYAAQHAARVSIDEQGITAAAYTMVYPVAADDVEPPPTVDFILDRPFVFAVTSHDGLPLFVGIINNP